MIALKAAHGPIAVAPSGGGLGEASRDVPDGAPTVGAAGRELPDGWSPPLSAATALPERNCWR